MKPFYEVYYSDLNCYFYYDAHTDELIVKSSKKLSFIEVISLM